MNKLRIASALVTALVVSVFSSSLAAESLSELVSRAKAARKSGNCELAIRLYRKIRRQVADPTTNATVAKRIAECRGLLYKKYLALADRESCANALPHLERALEHAPHKVARETLLKRRSTCQRQMLQKGVLASVESGDCDRLAGALARLRVSHPDDALLQPLRVQQLERGALKSAETRRELDAVGRCHELQSRFEDALKAYRSYLAQKPNASNAPTIRARIARLGKVAKQTTRVLRITSAPSGARVLIGGRSGTTPFELRLPLGRYTVALQLAGYRDDVRSIELREGKEPQRLEHRFVPLAPKSPSLTQKPARKRDARYLWAALGTGVAGLALIGTGVAFSFLRNSAIKDANKLAADTPAIQRDYVFFESYTNKTGKADRNKKLAIVFYTVGGLSLATSVALLIVYAVRKGPAEEQSWRLVPQLQRGGVTFGAHVDFE